MAKVSNKQTVLKPQDLYVLLALLSRGGGSVGYPELAEQTGLAVSAVHGALKRAAAAQLAMFQDRRPVVLKTQLREFLLYGAKYVFPPIWGSLARGVPTGYAAAPLNALIAPSSDPVPVGADRICDGTLECLDCTIFRSRAGLAASQGGGARCEPGAFVSFGSGGGAQG